MEKQAFTWPHGNKIKEPAEFRISRDPLRFRALSRRGSGGCQKKFLNFEVVVVVVFYLFADILIVQWPTKATDKTQSGK